MPDTRGPTALSAAAHTAYARAVAIRCEKGRTGELQVDAVPAQIIMSTQNSDRLDLWAQVRLDGITGEPRESDDADGMVALTLRPGTAVEGFDNGVAAATAPATIEVPVRTEGDTPGKGNGNGNTNAKGNGNGNGDGPAEGPAVLTGLWTLPGTRWEGVPGDYSVLVKGVTLAIPGAGKCRVAAGAETPVATFSLRAPTASGLRTTGPSSDASTGPAAGPFTGPASGDGRGVGIGWLAAILMLIIAVVAVWRVTSARRPPDPVTGPDDGAGVGHRP